MTRLHLIVGNWSENLGDGETIVAEVPDPELTSEQIILGYEAENVPERKTLDEWAEKHIYPLVKDGPRLDFEDGSEWISVYFAGPPEFDLFDCEYNFDANTGKAVGGG